MKSLLSRSLFALTIGSLYQPLAIASGAMDMFMPYEDYSEVAVPTGGTQWENLLSQSKTLSAITEKLALENLDSDLSQLLNDPTFEPVAGLADELKRQLLLTETLANLESQLPAAILKIIPSFLQSTSCGITDVAPVFADFGQIQSGRTPEDYKQTFAVHVQCSKPSKILIVAAESAPLPGNPIGNYGSTLKAKIRNNTGTHPAEVTFLIEGKPISSKSIHAMPGIETRIDLEAFIHETGNRNSTPSNTGTISSLSPFSRLMIIEVD